MKTSQSFGMHFTIKKEKAKDGVTNVYVSVTINKERIHFALHLIKHTFNTADLLGKSSDRVVFDIGGNNYMMVCNYVFGTEQVHLFVCWIGTHTDYDKVCKKGLQYIINLY